MSDIPAFPYRLLWEERVIRSVANLTRRDAEEFLALAPAAGITDDDADLPARRRQSRAAPICAAARCRAPPCWCRRLRRAPTARRSAGLVLRRTAGCARRLLLGLFGTHLPTQAPAFRCGACSPDGSRVRNIPGPNRQRPAAVPRGRNRSRGDAARRSDRRGQNGDRMHLADPPSASPPENPTTRPVSHRRPRTFGLKARLPFSHRRTAPAAALSLDSLEAKALRDRQPWRPAAAPSPFRFSLDAAKR